MGNTENRMFNITCPASNQLQKKIRKKNWNPGGPSSPHPAERPAADRSAPQPPASASLTQRPHPSWSDHRPSATWLEGENGLVREMVWVLGSPGYPVNQMEVGCGFHKRLQFGPILSTSTQRKWKNIWNSRWMVCRKLCGHIGCSKSLTIHNSIDFTSSPLMSGLDQMFLLRQKLQRIRVKAVQLGTWHVCTYSSSLQRLENVHLFPLLIQCGPCAEASPWWWKSHWERGRELYKHLALAHQLCSASKSDV